MSKQKRPSAKPLKDYEAGTLRAMRVVAVRREARSPYEI